MTTAQQDLIRRTYDAFMYARTSGDIDGGREKLRALRAEAGEQWDGIRNAALMYDVKRNG